MESLKAGIVVKKISLYDNSDFASSRSKSEAYLDVMSILMVDVMTEAAMTVMKRKTNLLMEVFKEREHEITALREQI